MKVHLYRFLYNLLSGLSYHIPHKTLIRYKLFTGAFLLSIQAGHTQESVSLKKQPEQTSDSLQQSNLSSFLPDTATQIVKGQVLDEMQIPLAGVSIVAKGTNLGTYSDSCGNFTLRVPGYVKELVFDFIGFKSLKVQIEPVIKVILEENEAILCYEVIVVSYKKEKKKTGRRKRNKKDTTETK